jgi:hypothetical protein
MRSAFLIVLWLLVQAVSWDADADDYSFRYGLGVIGKPTTQIKVFGLRHESNIAYALYDATEIGFYNDTGEAEGRHSAGFASYQLGVKPGTDNVYFSAFWGFAGITHTDSQLGGLAQFTSDFAFGFRDRISFVQLGLKHISSAGIWKPNHGRDFILLSMGVTL